MKKKCFTFLVLMAPLCLLAQQQNQPYNYPSPRGSASWNELTTYKEKRDASQVPDAIVQKLTTAALLETVLNYPLLADVMVFNNLQAGVDNLKATFRALPALLQRSDVAAVCIARYKRLPVDSVNVIPELVNKGAYSFQQNVLEILMAQPELTSKLSAADQRSLLKLLIQHFDAKEKLPEVYGTFSRSVNAWPVYRLSQKLPDNQKAIKADTNLDKGVLLNYTDWKSVIDNARALNR